MKLKFVIILLAFTFLSCENEPKANLFVKGNIEGVRKGDIYLQKLEDTLLVNLDSVQFSGNEDFELKANIDEPQLMYLYLKKFGSEEDIEYLDFFAEAGEFEFNTKMEEFSQAKADKAPENQIKYEDYQEILKRFNDQNLDLITERIKTEAEDTLGQRKIDEKYSNLLRRKYLYTINFAVKNADYEIAPFLVLSEAYNANKRYLDTVYKSLSKNVKKSKYGLELESLIQLREEEAKKQNVEVETIDKEIK